MGGAPLPSSAALKPPLGATRVATLISYSLTRLPTQPLYKVIQQQRPAMVLVVVAEVVADLQKGDAIKGIAEGAAVSSGAEGAAHTAGAAHTMVPGLSEQPSTRPACHNTLLATTTAHLAAEAQEAAAPWGVGGGKRTGW